ncbi:hypothetical protein SSPS47_18990 [Streptomyces sp. S4.7]|uniref:hypothetical protein n=1 Tax=Streptomyces sp. S4.7 TaxID=2705439 RepID=UPI00139939AA|nr:hypothetical protein [Streptomyces sp. S4.7]QHY97197.1 hypothetical protein SSPS47_18990 [Streptomyces sp. S4.7]
MGPNQRFKNELDTLIDQQLLPEDREAARPPAPPGPPSAPGRTNRPAPADTPQPSLPKQQNGAHD